MDIRKELFKLQDLGYKAFQSKLIPTMDPDKMIGIRMPILRKFAKQIAKTTAATEFLLDLPHKYNDEDNLHALLICQMSDYKAAVAATETFVGHIDNWATCDLFVPKIFGKNLASLEPKIEAWLDSDHVYTRRYAVVMLLSFYLGDAFKLKHPKRLVQIETHEYYVNMAVAWYFATALAKQEEAILPFYEKKLMPEKVHKLAIRKAVESYRINTPLKNHLRKLR
jgi:3-methyladenine DNA glycosylase AlkD